MCFRKLGSLAMPTRKKVKEMKPLTLAVCVTIAILFVGACGCTSSTSSNKATATTLTINEKETNSSIEATLGPYSYNTGYETVQWFINDKPSGNTTTNQMGHTFLPLKSLPNYLTFGEKYKVRVEFKGVSTLSPSTCSTTLVFPVSQLDIFNQTVGLVTSGAFPSLSNAMSFPGAYLDFEVEKKDDASWQRIHAAYYVHEPCTVFFLKRTALERTGQYVSDSGIRTGYAYRGQFDIYAVKYPEKTLIGKYTFISDPPSTSPLFSEQIGNTADWYTWIKQHTTGNTAK
jgi:hypothetical protein